MFWIKFLGIILIVFSCSTVGFLKSASIKKRSQKLTCFCEGLDMLYEYVEQGGTELYYAIKKSFSRCEFLHSSGNRFFCEDIDLNREDKALIDNFFKSLGISVKKVECEHIHNCKSGMKIRANQAENDVNQKSKIYQMFGICIGIVIGILLI